MHHLSCGLWNTIRYEEFNVDSKAEYSALSSSLLHFVNLIPSTLLLVHLILRISPHHSHHLCSHHLSLPLPFTPELKLISFPNPFLPGAYLEGGRTGAPPKLSEH